MSYILAKKQKLKKLANSLQLSKISLTFALEINNHT